MEHDIRPWGAFWVLEEAETHKVKKILVNPGGRLSLQYHHHRSEVWTVISGRGNVTLNGTVQQLNVGDTISIPQGAHHRIENSGDVPLIFIEVQWGTYFGEDDIKRLEDDYQRI